jgi:glycosyltransferase involved in cell wall biosynthesis
MRICCLNNYPLDKMVQRAQDGLIPGQHGWGLQQLRNSPHEVLVAPFREAIDRGPLDRLSATSRYLFGQLDQEWWALRRRPDLLYAADQQSLAGIAMARDLVARRARLISVVHHPLRGQGARMRLAAIKAHDAVLTLTEPVCRDLAQAGLAARFVPWGPDLSSDLYAKSHDGGFAISTGKSNRDIPVLVRALAETGFPGRVFDLNATVAGPPQNVVLVRPGGVGTDPVTGNGYLAQSVLDMTRESGFVAIPIADPNRLTGLTEINDALALGKPIVITKSPYTPVDVEAIGCGIVVAPGDVDGWIAAINCLRDPEVRSDMGARGRRYAERQWNYEIFGAALLDLVAEA